MCRGVEEDEVDILFLFFLSFLCVELEEAQKIYLPCLVRC